MITHSSLALFFPERMDATDRANLEISGVKRVQMFLGGAANSSEQLDYLAGQGVRVTLRIEEPDRGQEGGSYYNHNNHGTILSQVRAVKLRVPVEAVIPGNEPPEPFDLTWGSPNWGNNPDAQFPRPGGKAQAHCDAVLALIQPLHNMGIRVVSPGWTHRRITPRDVPEPGRATWREITLPAYNAVDANSIHLYSHSWVSPEDENRYLWAAGNEIERCHRVGWINETNTNSGTPLERMQAVVKMAALLNSVPWGSRIVSFCPFVSNGLGNSYKPGYIMRDSECYRLLATMP